MTLDSVVHRPTRLAVLGLARAVDEASFAWLEGRLGVSSSSLSKHLTALAEAGYVEVVKHPQLIRRPPTTGVQITSAGRDALTAYHAGISALLDPEV